MEDFSDAVTHNDELIVDHCTTKDERVIDVASSHDGAELVVDFAQDAKPVLENMPWLLGLLNLLLGWPRMVNPLNLLLEWPPNAEPGATLHTMLFKMRQATSAVCK